jgi:hypothetical protein
MTPDNLDSLSLEELDEVFAQEVMMWPIENRGMESGDGITWRPCIAGPGFVHALPPSPPPVSTSADAVLPWLEKHGLEIHRIHRIKVGYVWEVSVYNDGSYFPVEAEAPTFPYAACLALIRACRARKGS